MVLSLGLTTAGCHGPAPALSPSPLSGPRIVSLTPNLTEILFALEAGPQVVAVTRNDHFPAEVDALPEVGDLNLDYEALLSLQPDLVVYDPALNAAHVAQLKRLGLTLSEYPTQSLEQMLSTISALGERLDRRQQAERLVSKLRGELEAGRRRASQWKRQPRALVEIWYEPLVGAGEGSYVSEVIERAGLQNVLRGRPGYPNLSLEELHALDPDIVVLTHPVLAQLRANPVWARLRAVREEHVLVVEEDLLVRPGPRVTRALRQLQDWVESKTLHK
jgi:iron complex transport system substrate-binding protein